MYCSPVNLLSSGVLVHLSIRDLQAVNVAFTSTPTHRAQIKELWKSYPYECDDEVGATLTDLVWLKSVDMKPVGIVLLNNMRNMVPIFVEYVASNFPTLRYFKNDTFEFSDALLMKLAQGCPLLEVVRFPCGKVTNASILALVQNCRQLHTLDLENFFPGEMHNSTIEIICSHCPHLKHISIYFGSSFTDASLITIANTYPRLQSIVMHSDNFTDDGLIYFADKCHELQSINVGGSLITSRGLTALWAANPNLMDVDICDNKFILNDDIIRSVQCCPLLQVLDMSGCRLITDAAVIAVAEHCPQLRSLDISECNDLSSDASLIALGQHCHQLKSINISYLEYISDVGIAALAAGCPLLQEFYAIDTNTTNAGVVELVRGCRDLRKVNLSGCIQIDIDGVSAIAENCPLISEFYLSSNEGINDACLYVIAQHCRNLICLSVDRHGISSESVQAVYRCCRNIRKFT